MRPAESRVPLRAVAFAVVLLAVRVAIASPLAAQLPIPVLVEGLADGEFWSTTAHSNLLTRNDGRSSGLARVNLWAAVEPLPGLVFYGQGEMEGGSARLESKNFEVYGEQYGVRYVVSPAFVIDAGKLQPIVGTFASRHFSNRNPLIGSPDGYSLAYPLGVQISGESHHVDYRAGLVSLPTSHESYVPSATPRLRPAIGAGFTPMTGLRIGGSFTAGPYLNHDFTTDQLRGQSWADYSQRVVALDVAFARGYLETHAEAARGTYEVPGRAGALMGYTYYGEAKYTFTPRFFVAGRLERNNYPFIRPFGTNWVARLTDFVDAEAGIGYRLTESMLVKASARADRWWVAPGSTGFLGQGGPAVAVQVSQSFDALSWLTRAK